LKGGVTIQQFFEEVRDAPAEVLDLREELELFAVVARDTEKVLQHANETFTTIDTVNFPRALERCECIVKEIGIGMDNAQGLQDKIRDSGGDD
jgi:hypothetical protein